MTNGWQVYRVGDLLTQNSNNVKVAADKSYKLLGISLEGRGAFLREEKTGDSISAPSLSPVHAGDFIYSRLFAWRGAFDVVSQELDGCFVSNEFPTFKINTEILLPKFLRLYFNRKIVWEEVEKYCTGTTKASRNRFKEQFFLDMEIPLPPLTEQRRIVAHIESLAERVDEAQRLREEADAEVNALYNAALAASIPWGANAVSLLETIEEGTTITYGVLVPGHDVDDGVPFVRIQDLDFHNPSPKPNKKIAPEISAQYKRTLLQGGEILIGVVGATIGKIGIAPKEWKGANIARAVCRIIPSKEFNTKYLAYVLLSSPSQKFFKDTTRTLAQPTLNVSQLEQTPIPVPPLDEQRRIVAYLDGLQAKVNALRGLQSQSQEELDALLPSVLDRAFKGEL